MIQVEFEDAVVYDAILLPQEIWDQLEVLVGTGPGEVAGHGELGFLQHLGLDVERFAGEVIVFVCFVEFGRLLEITVDEVSKTVVVAELFPI